MLGGDPVVSQQVNEIVATDMKRAELIALPLLFLLSFLIFRGLVAAMLPPLVGLVTVAGALLGLRVASEMTSLSIYALNLITGLGLGLAIDWSLFIVSRYREELAVHGPGATALRETMRTAGRTVLFSSLTVAAALASLLVFPQSFLRSMGVGGMLVALIGAGVALLFLPVVLALLGRRVDSLSPRRFQRASAKAARPASSGYWFRLSHLVMKRPVVIAAATAGLLLVLGVPFAGVRFTGFDPSVLPKASSGRQVDRIVQTEFATDLNPAAYAVVSAPATARTELRRYAARLDALPGSPSVAVPRLAGLGTWVIDVGSSARRNSNAGQRLVDRMRAVPSPYPVLVGGDSASLVDQKASLVSHLPWALAILVGATLLVLFLMTGSILLPIKAIALNLLTISAVFGVLVWIFQDGRLQGVLGYSGQGGIDTTQPILIAAVAFGLSTDYGVFLLTRIKEARDGGADNQGRGRLRARAHRPDRDRRGLPLHRRDRRVRRLADRHDQGGRARHRARRVDRRDPRARAARPVADDAARPRELVGAAAAALGDSPHLVFGVASRACLPGPPSASSRSRRWRYLRCPGLRCSTSSRRASATAAAPGSSRCWGSRPVRSCT